MKKGALLFILICLGLVPLLAPLSIEAANQWTFMVYINGDNNLESAGINDFLEMAQVGSDDDVDIVVQFDRIDGYTSSYYNWTTCRRYHITAGMTPGRNRFEDIGEVNMADDAVLEAFITWATANFPSPKYALVIWNHGDGWRQTMDRVLEGKQAENVIAWKHGNNVGSIINGARDQLAALSRSAGYDETSDDYLYMNEVQSAISSAGLNPDLLGFDACLMGMVEVAYEVRDLANVMVGSEEVEPGDGWPYDTILSDLVNNPGWDAAQLAQSIVTRYGESYGSESMTTMSALNLSQVSDLATAVDNFAQTMDSNWGELKTARAGAQEFYNDNIGYIDLWHFADMVSTYCSDPGIVAAAGDVKAEVDNTVISEFHGSALPDAHGVTIYFPERAKTHDIYDRFYEDPQHDFAAFNWDEFLKSYLIETAPSIASSYTSSPPTIDGAITPAEWAGATVVDIGPRLVNDWDWGVPTSGPGASHSGTRCWATDLDEDYHNYNTGWIQTPQIDLSGAANPQLAFWQYYDMEAGYDYGYVDISDDGGNSWTNLQSYTDSQGSWIQEGLDLSPFIGQQVIVRFYFASDHSFNYPGWYIDDVEVTDGGNTLYSSDFEADNGGMTLGDGPRAVNDWEWGVPTSGPGASHSGTRCWATDLDEDYHNYNTGWIQTPQIDLSGAANPQLAFWQYYDMEAGYDYGYVDISDDGGNSWTNLQSYTDSQGSWIQEGLDLSPFIGQQVIVRFYFASDHSFNYPGWYIDDVEVTDGGNTLYSSDFEADNGGMTRPSPPSETITVTAYIMNDDQYLYIAVIDQFDTSLDVDDQVGIYFDDDHNHCWDTSSSTNEGNYWSYWDGSGWAKEFRGMWYDFDNYTYNAVDAVSADDVLNAGSISSGHMQHEIRIDLTTGALRAAPGSTIGFHFYTYDSPTVFDDWVWPAGIGEDGQVIEPLFYGNLTLAEEVSPPVSITIATSPSGKQITVDGTDYTVAQTFEWQVGSEHTIGLSSPQGAGAGTRYLYDHWSDGGPQTHTITVPSSSTTYTAYFSTQYSLTTSPNPLEGGSVNPSSTTWHDSAVTASVTATANTGYKFSGWGGDASGTQNPLPVLINAPKDISASFCLLPAIPSNPSPSNGATDVSVSADLDWDDSSGATSYDVYFGTTPSPSQVATVTGSSYELGTLDYEIIYYWKTVAKSDCGDTSGPMWQFTTLQHPKVEITIATSPSALQITVDGAGYPAPKTFGWQVGSEHTIGVSSPQSAGAGTRYLYDHWNDSDAQTHTITVPSSSTTYTAYFSTQYSLTTSPNPLEGGSVNPSSTTWHDSAVTASVTATANTGYKFSGWGGDASGTQNPLPVLINAPKDISASFCLLPAIPSNPSPSNGATDVSVSADLDWDDSSGATSYDVYFGTTSPPPEVDTVASSSYDPGALDYETVYYWKIVARNACGDTEGPIWEFTTNPVYVWYVDVESSGNGASWSEAFETIQEAIDAAGDGDEIWVKMGDYALSSQINVDKAVKIYGGFAGTESERDERNWQNNVTTVDGQDVAYHCFFITAGGTIDGFFITGGNANGSTSPDNCGGGIYTAFSFPTITNCLLSGNSADYGSGIYNHNSSPTITNCIFAGNSADLSGGGICNESSSPTITNCTFSGNSAVSGGGGIYNSHCSPTITNCILWGDTAPDGTEIYDEDSSPTVTYCDIDQTGYAGSNENIRHDPLFFEASSSDFHLQPGSPCIDAGNNYAPNLPATDFEGDQRIIDGNNDGTVTVDMGADEYNDTDTVPAPPGGSDGGGCFIATSAY